MKSLQSSKLNKRQQLKLKSAPKINKLKQRQHKRVITLQHQQRSISTQSLSSLYNPAATTTTIPTITRGVKKHQFKSTKSSLFTLSMRLFGCEASSCGCGSTATVNDQQEQLNNNNNNSNNTEFIEPQYNDKNIKTIEKMRKQQRDFSLRLYRSILREHRNLPPEMRMLGDPYVKEEFKLHKTAKPEHLQPFFEQWIDYLAHLRETFNTPEAIGKNIPINTIDQLDDEQKEKLFKMHDETYRIFGGELNETDIGLQLNQIPTHLRESGIFGEQEQQDNHNDDSTIIHSKPTIKTTTISNNKDQI